jgi:hypothetical protein
MKTYIPRARINQSSHWFGIQMMDMVYTMVAVSVVASRLPQNFRALSFLLMPVGIFIFSKIRTRTRPLFLIDWVSYHILPKRITYDKFKSY